MRVTRRTRIVIGVQIGVYAGAIFAGIVNGANGSLGPTTFRILICAAVATGAALGFLAAEVINHYRKE